MIINILNKHHGKAGEYIGRPSPLGNPYVIGKDGTREEVIVKYKVWLYQELKKKNPAIRKELRRLHNILIETEELNLVCWCAPKACHGDVIKELIMRYVK